MLTSCTDTKNNLNILKIMQICDSNFPIGSFNHSYGMETYLRDNRIKDTESFRSWIRAFFRNQFIYSDGFSIKLLYEYLDKKSEKKILELDRSITVQSMAFETRNGNKMVAKRMLNLFLDLYDSKILEIYLEKINKKEAFGHPAIVFGILMYELKVNLIDAIQYYMYSTASTLIQNAVRTIPLGQKDGQILLKESSESFLELSEIIQTLDEDMFGANVPGIELAQIQHETLIFRLFMS
ncbi:urease accessory protein UreF [Clostridium thermobutyricum]|uniref:Urease accessory protein UreF n=1 Tax=Clostridium thermobutyricum DSM 4928 TaxID=1121339 RepID=A0A1V4STQ1_9CLOT|nr:urease accessory protein UreF [Clostridium thermobutyricum]OPX46836.1 urease accessory protein UreF [Clostridium thermobutyricum DSM 4928]